MHRKRRTPSITLARKPTAGAAEKAIALDGVLKKSQELKAKVEACADDIGTANDVVKNKIAGGTTTLSAPEALADNERVESNVQECADELHQVNESLAHGIDDLKQIEVTLTKSQEALADTETALATALDGERQARLRAMHDTKTGLPNRELFDDRLAQAISMAERHNWTLAVMFFDLDRFKSINDKHGHAVGDWVLKEVAKRLLEHARDEDTVARTGGDEFLYLLVNPKGRENVERIAGVALKAISKPIDFEGLQIVIKPSIGLAVYPENGTTGEQLIRKADTAMYRAKKDARGWAFFDERETERGLSH